MIWLLALANAAVLFLLASPSPSERQPPWAGAGETAPPSPWERFRGEQARVVANEGLLISPALLVAIRLVIAGVGALLMGWLLGPVSALCGAIAGWLAIQEWIDSRKEGRMLQFADQFREVLQSIANSLRAGRAMQQALAQAHEDLLRIPGREHGLMAQQLSIMLDQLRVNLPLDQVIDGLSTRVSLEEVRLFADAVRICRVRGGNLVQVLQTLIRLNVDRFQVRQEIRVQTAQKRMEGGIISAMPMVMLIVLNLISPEYMAPLTSTAIGQGLIGVGLLAVLIAFLISRRLTRIEV